MNKCEKCDKEFKKNCQLQNHLNRKFPCITIEGIINKYLNKIKKIDNDIEEITKISIETNKECNFCNKTFSSKHNLIRHIEKSCLSKKEMINKRDKLNNDKDKLINENITEKLTNKINELQNSIDDLKNKDIITTQNITNNIQNNLIVNINSFGKETLNHITLQDYKKYFNSFFKGFLNFIEKVHFDENAPENHNLCITNIKSKYIHVYENNDWILKEKNDIIDDLVTNKFNLLTNKYEELEEAKQLNNKTINNFEEFQQNYENKDAQKNTKKDVSLMVYNNKEKVNIKK